MIRGAQGSRQKYQAACMLCDVLPLPCHSCLFLRTIPLGFSVSVEPHGAQRTALQCRWCWRRLPRCHVTLMKAASTRVRDARCVVMSYALTACMPPTRQPSSTSPHSQAAPKKRRPFLPVARFTGGAQTDAADAALGVRASGGAASAGGDATGNGSKHTSRAPAAHASRAPAGAAISGPTSSGPRLLHVLPSRRGFCALPPPALLCVSSRAPTAAMLSGPTSMGGGGHRPAGKGRRQSLLSGGIAERC